MTKPTTKEMLKELEGYGLLVVGRNPRGKKWEAEQFIKLTDGLIRVSGFGKTKRSAIEECLRIVKENLSE